MSVSTCNSYTDEEGRELLVHGNHLFPIASYADNITEESVPWHWHDELEAGIIISGTVIIATNLGSYELHAGEGFYLGPGVMHSVEPSNIAKEECLLHSIVFNPMIVSGNLESIFHEKYVKPLLENPFYEFLALRAEKDKELLSYINTAWQLNTLEPAGFEIEVRYTLSCMLNALGHITHTECKESDRNFRGAVRIKSMVSYIQHHFHEDINLKDIASSANISESEVLREFNTFIGITPIKYLIQYRIQIAATLLTTTNIKIAEICNKCGFTDVSYFTKVFRKLKGMPPAKYRKANGMN